MIVRLVVAICVCTALWGAGAVNAAVPARSSMDWLHPNADPLKLPLSEAMERFAPEIPDAHARNQLLRMIVTGDGCRQTLISDGMTFDVMQFGKGVKRANVTARTSKWPAEVSRTLRMCKVRGKDGKKEYAVFLPDVCGNLALIITRIEDCIPCPTC